MRRFLGILRDIRKANLAERQASPERLAEVDAKFGYLDANLNGVVAGDSTPEKFAEVMTSGDFTYAIQEFVQRKSLPGYQRKVFNFEPLVKMDIVPNYLPVTRYQNRCGVDDLELVTEKGQARPGSVHDATKRQYQVYRFEKQYDLSHEALVNDDIGYFENMAEMMGEAARRTLEKFVSRLYTNAVSILVLTTAGALYSQNGRLTSARVSEARMAFNQRTDACSEPINASLGYIVHHSGLKDTALQIQASELVPELATNAANIVRNTVFIEDPYITGTAPNLPWYGFVDYNATGIVPFVLARRQGMPGPQIRRKRSDVESVTSMLGAGTAVDPIWGDFDSGNIVLKVVDVWGTYVGGDGYGNLFDYRGAYYSSGTVM
jgi:hypothetical protein